MFKKLGVIGCGFVGTAVYEGMKHAFEIVVYDPVKVVPDAENCPPQEMAQVVDGPIFICVPTPMRQDGSCDTSIVEGVVAELDRAKTSVIAVIKSTVAPGTTHRLNTLYQNVRCVFNPEFLREATFIEDFKKQDRIIIGGPHEATSVVKQMYQHAYPEVPTTKTHETIAEMVKYVTNCFLATKVSFANEISQICNELGIDYDKVVEYATKDGRLGNSHWSVPGPDGKIGFGQKCFPKDLNALIAVARSLGVDPKVMRAAWEKNLELRPERDWEAIPGAVVKGA